MEVKSIHGSCSQWVHKNCKGSIPIELCEKYTKLHPETNIHCGSIDEEPRVKLKRECGCYCLKKFTDKLPLWPIQNSVDWGRGKFENTEKGGKGDYIKLTENSDSGKWISPVRDWFKNVKYAYVDFDSEVDKGNIEVKIEVSNNDFEDVKDSTTKMLSGGLESFGLCNLSSSKYLKISARLRSNAGDKELTTLHGIWLYINKTKPVDKKRIDEKYPEN